MKSMSISKRPQRAPSPLLSCEDSEKRAVCEPGRWLSPGTTSAGALVLDFSASRNMRNTSLLFKPPNLRYFCYSSLNGWRQDITRVYLWGGRMARFNLSKKNGWFCGQHSRDPGFCRSRAEDHTPAICYSAAREKWGGGCNSDSFLRDKFPGYKTTSGVH